MKTPNPIKAFKSKKQELKDWLYGTVYKLYDTEETAEVVQTDVEDFFTDEWFAEMMSLAQTAERERCEKLVWEWFGKWLQENKVIPFAHVEKVLTEHFEKEFLKSLTPSNTDTNSV